MNLRVNEQIIKKIDHHNGVPMKLEDWIRVPLLFLFVIGGMIWVVAYIVTNQPAREFYSCFIGAFFAIYAGVFLYKLLYIRKRDIIDTEYILTNERLIFFSKRKNEITKSFNYSNFPPFTYKESPYNNGYIIIGRVEEFFVTQRGFLYQRTGINLQDHEIVLENLPQVKKEYDFLKSCIEKYKTELTAN
ncbi:MAG: hypothetical protein ACO1O6_05915 [Bacteroidota bacterium]